MSLPPDLTTPPAAPAPVLTLPGADHRPRWQPGERLHHLFEQRVDQLARDGQTAKLAVDSTLEQLTYAALDARANRLARALHQHGHKAGDVIGLLFDKSADSYAAMLAVLKIHAAYVPLDAGFPADRIAYIVADSGVSRMLSTGEYAELLADCGAPVLMLDAARAEINALPGHRLSAAEIGPSTSELCYVIYTSGSTGRPKGVPIDQDSIVNFVRVAAETYGYRPDDRVYQGLTLAFDFAVEEIWVPLVVGATLLPNQSGASLVGHDLADFLRSQRATALCCVPTLLATLDDDQPQLRLLIVSGEACPRDLVTRWHRPGRRFLNAYGPTEATVTATLGEPKPNQPVTIGRPLPTYAIVILAPDEARALPFGTAGEIGIAGVGIARGYLNRDDQTRKAFIPDFLAIAHNASGRIYRTGDLGRINEAGEVEYLGRIDTQVKIRGYRIELAEIESVLMQLPAIAQAVVNTWEASPGVVELVAYTTTKPGSTPMSPERLAQALRISLPSYMVPAFYEALDSIPMLASNKADRKALPPPRGERLQPAQRPFVAPDGARETAIAQVLARVLKLEKVSAEDHFFNDLGANSLMVAQLATAFRTELGLGAVSMKAMYQHPTVRTLAAHLADSPTAAPVRLQTPPYRAPHAHYVACGAAQAVLGFLFVWAHSAAIWHSYSWVLGATSWGQAYSRTLVAVVGYFLASALIPVGLKWLIVGRQKAQDIRVWSLTYLRFWTVRQLIRLNPVALMTGTPVYTLYLKLLGADVSWQALLATRLATACPDLLHVGARAVIPTNVLMTGYKAERGLIRIAPIQIGHEVYIGDGSLVDIGVVLEDGSQLAHGSAVLEGQRLKAGRSYHGSPAQDAPGSFASLPMTARPSTTLRWAFGLGQVFSLWCLYLPLPFLAAYAVLGDSAAATLDTTPAAESGFWGWLQNLSATLIALESGTGSFGSMVAVALLLFVASLLGGLALNIGAPRLLERFFKPGAVYPLYGLHYLLHRNIRRLGNSNFYNLVFGDSSFIITYLRALGYRFGTVEQTGSNFGVVQRHDSPGLVHIGAGAIISDGLNALNANYGAASFSLNPVSIGARNFLGNNIFVPSTTRVGENCLLGTKVMVPTEGPMRHDIGLLGSPPFEIPRSVRSDHRFDHYKTPEILPSRLRLKNRANAGTLLIFLGYKAAVAVMLALLWELSYAQLHHLEGLYLALFNFASLVVVLLAQVLADQASIGFGRLSPQYCSIYDEYFWRHERHWKMALNDMEGVIKVLNGTPFKGLLMRARGLKAGKQLFDDGGCVTEKTLTTLGDYCMLGELSSVQSHTLEDGTFKSDHIVIGDDCTIAANSYVLYDVVVGSGAVVAPDAFVMKGERLAPNALWQGNPAREMTA